MIRVASALPLDLVFEPVSRRPLVLPTETIRWALDREVPSGRRRKPEVSIIVVTHENLAITRLCLETVLAEQDGPGFEVIVVDNGSSDLTPAFLTDLASSHQAVRVVVNAQNLGFAAGVNVGLAAARGDVLVILNNDVVVSPGWLGRLLPVLNQDGVGMVGPVTNAAPNEARVAAGYATYGEFLDHAEARWADHGEATFDIDVLTMFCVAIRLDVFRSVGPLDEQFGLGMFEDDDYARRVRAAGHRLVCADGVFVHHFGEASFGKLVPTGHHGELFRRNRQLFDQKWGVRWTSHHGREQPEYHQMTERMREAVDATVPPGAILVVVSKGDDVLLELGPRTGWHFPRDVGGSYAGHYPSNIGAVIDQLNEVRRLGATHLVFPQTSLWWLYHYAGLEHHLDRCCERIVEDRACLIFRWLPQAV